MSRFGHQKYTYQNRFGSPEHSWSIIGPRGGVHFHITMVKDYDPCPGLEFHYTEPPPYMKDDAPSHVNCWLVGARCWHDGTSMYARETIWPMVETYLRNGDHDAVFRLLEGEYERNWRRLDEMAAEEAA